jgi:hypothetical protein
MDITLHPVSRHRAVPRAFARVHGFLAAVSAACRVRVVEPAGFDVVQILFRDEPEDHVRPIGPGHRRGGVFQVEVGPPNGISFAPDQDALLLEGLVRQAVRALNAVPMGDANRSAAEAAFAETLRTWNAAR